MLPIYYQTRNINIPRYYELDVYDIHGQVHHQKARSDSIKVIMNPQDAWPFVKIAAAFSCLIVIAALPDLTTSSLPRGA